MATLRHKQGQKNKARSECKCKRNDFKVPANGKSYGYGEKFKFLAS